MGKVAKVFLQDKDLRNLTPKEKMYLRAVGSPKELYVKVYPSGIKTFVLKVNAKYLKIKEFRAGLYSVAIADLVLKNEIKELKNCVYDYLDDDEAKELYEILKKYKTLDNIKNFLKYELTKYYFLDKENKDFRAMLDYGGQSHLGNYPLKIEVSNRNKIFLQQGSLTYTNIDGVNVYNISELIDMKIAAFNGRDKVRDLYDLNFLLNKYPEYFDYKQLWQINERIAYCGTDELNILLADEVKKHKLISNENIDLNNFVQNFQARIENTLNDKRIEKQKEFIKNLSIKDKQIQNREPQRGR